MGFEKAEIPGLILYTPKKFTDARGYFFESFNKKVWQNEIDNPEFVQDNISSSDRFTVRGLHMQVGEAAQAKLVRVAKGKVRDIVVDLREGSPSFGRSYSVDLSEENQLQMYVPRGFLHGFSVLSDEATFCYKCDNFYNQGAEAGVIFNDPTLKLDWGFNLDEAHLSDKDQLLGSFNSVSSGVKYEV